MGGYTGDDRKARVSDGCKAVMKRTHLRPPTEIRTLYRAKLPSDIWIRGKQIEIGTKPEDK
jgi:hypothetical protein